jgi:hypothetical protein
MAKTACRPQPTIFKDLSPQRQNCPTCGQRMWLDYTNDRTLVTFAGCLRLNLTIHRCHNRDCPVGRTQKRGSASERRRRRRASSARSLVASRLQTGRTRSGKNRCVEGPAAAEHSACRSVIG